MKRWKLGAKEVTLADKQELVARLPNLKKFKKEGKREMKRDIDIQTFSRFEYIDRFCEVEGIDLVWEGDKLIIEKREEK